MKIAYIIIMLILLIGYNGFFNKRKGQYDLSPLIRGAVSIILYLLTWIAWFIIF